MFKICVCLTLWATVYQISWRNWARQTLDIQYTILIPEAPWLKKCKFWNPRDILLWSTNYHALLIQLKSGCIRPNWPFAIAGGLQEGTSKISRITFFKKCLSCVRFSLSLLFCNFCKAQPLGSLWYLEWFWYPCKLQQSRVWQNLKMKY